jgi:beta-galactosidase
MSILVGEGTMVFSLRQDGNKLTGYVEGAGGGFFGGNDAPIQIEDGKVDGDQVSFKAGNSTFTGSLKDGKIDLQRKIDIGFPVPHPSEETAGRPAIGPPPDGSDPSFNISAAMRRAGAPIVPVVLHPVQR